MPRMSRPRWVLMRKKQALLVDVYKRDDGECFWCERLTALVNSVKGEPMLPSTATLDHIVPLSKDGVLLDPRNILLACFRCNCLRGNRDFDDFLEDRDRPGALDAEEPTRFQPVMRLEHQNQNTA